MLKYPKSKNNIQCIGPCYKANTTISHPTRSQLQVTQSTPFCPIGPIQKYNQNMQHNISYTAECIFPTESEDIQHKESNITSISEFTKHLFLSYYYEIMSFENAIEWLDNNENCPLKTKIRIINCALSTYEIINNLIDERFVTFYIVFLKETKLNFIYKIIHENIELKDKKVFISKNNKLKYDDYKIERMNYIVSKFLDKNNIYTFLVKYFKTKKTNVDLNILTNDLIVYMQNIISNILNDTK